MPLHCQKLFLRSTEATNVGGTLFNFLAPIRPVANLVQREVQSHLEACHAEVVQTCSIVKWGIRFLAFLRDEILLWIFLLRHWK